MLTDALDDGDGEPTTTTRSRPARETGSSVPRRRGELAPTSPRRSAHWLLPVGLTVIGLVGLYTLAFLIISGWITVTNSFRYGPTHTYQADARLGNQVGHILATNVHGTIYVAIFEPQLGGHVKARLYMGPKLNADAWGDLDAIVVTVAVQPVRMGAASWPVLIVHLVGSPQYDRLLFARPKMDFALVPGPGGYRVQV